MKIKIIQDYYQIKILINGLPHICILTKEYVGFNSWMDSETNCSIEFITKTNTFIVEYDSKEKWIAVLRAINNKL